MTHDKFKLAVLALCAGVALPVSLRAQTIAYGDGADASSSEGSGHEGRDGRTSGRPYGIKVAPYIEAAQMATAELSPGNDVLTYSRLAAGIDLSVTGRHTMASASLRYERYFGWGKKASDGDVISGIARGYATITPGVQIEAGALASRTSVDSNGASSLGGSLNDSTAGRVYSVYAGPTVSTQAGAVKIDGGYRIGYSRFEMPDSVVTAPGGSPADLFDDSVTHNASIHLATRPGDVLPVGIGAGANWLREDISNLDQRVDDRNARLDLTLPVGHDLALVGGVGYEDVEVSARDVLRDSLGAPVIGSDGRYKTDKSAPRQIAYETSGLIWDAGVIWRPSRRTALEAHVGRRYGSMTYYGSFAYAPSMRSSFNVSVYDSVSGFGGHVNRALAEMPAEFEANRNLLTGDITGCVGSSEGGNCLAGALGSVRSSVFRARGISASYNRSFGRTHAGIGTGYERRKFMAAPGTILAAANGIVDENWWLAAYMGTRVSEHGTISANAYANWFQSGVAGNGDTSVFGASAAYGHSFTHNLSATAALGIEGVSREAPLDDLWLASALVGVRYSF